MNTCSITLDAFSIADAVAITVGEGCNADAALVVVEPLATHMQHLQRL